MIVKSRELCPSCMRSAQGDRCPHCGGDLHRENPAFLLPVGASLYGGGGSRYLLAPLWARGASARPTLASSRRPDGGWR